ncbi:MAG: tyrosine-type recombinase/integrase, partial [Verrucomicrobiota bacterium]
MSGYNAEGKQIRENYTTRQDATARQQELESQFLGVTGPRLTHSRLTQEQIAEAEVFFHRLPPGRSPSFVLTFFLENYKESAVKILLSDAKDKFIEAKRAGNNRPDTINSLDYRISYLVREHPFKFVDQITSADISSAINRAGRNPVTRDNDRRAFLLFFSYCEKHGFCATNPVAKIEPIKMDREEPEILPVEGARAVLQASNDFKEGVCLPYVVLGMLCAIRPTELARLSWREIDLESKTVTIGAKLAKMRQRRIVEIPKNAIEWLLPHALKKTPLVGKNFRRNFDAVKTLAGYEGRRAKTKPEKEMSAVASRRNKSQTEKAAAPELKPWTADVMRHTGISYHLAQHQHEGKTATWAGNSPDVIQRHYKGLVKPKDAKEFWQIKPAAKKILQM